MSQGNECSYVLDQRGIGTVTLDRPPVNALSLPLMNQIVDVFTDIQSDPDVRVVVLRATGKVFCAGIDLKEKASGGSTLAIPRARLGAAMQEAMSAIPVPLIAAVNGAALGGGCAIATYCDMIVASDRATFGVTDIEVGMIGGSALIRRHLPLNVVRRMIFTAQRLPAARAYELGMVDSIVSPAELWDAAESLAADIAGRSPGAVREMKQLLRTGEYLDWRNLYWVESMAARAYQRGSESQAMTHAFVSKGSDSGSADGK